MNETFLSHKRLDSGDALSIIKTMIGRSAEECAELVAFDHPKAYPPPVTRAIADSAYHKELRSGCVDLASKYGFPVRGKTKSNIYSQFDAEMGNFLHAHLKITPHEAGLEEVWNFLTLVVFPDIAAWRYPNENENPTYSRWVGKPRNVLRKTWWRTFNLGPQFNLLIGEDEGVAIMERPTFGFNPLLARAIVSVHTRRALGSDFPRSEILRVLMVQLGKIVTIVDLDSLSFDELEILIDEVYDRTLESLRASNP